MVFFVMDDYVEVKRKWKTFPIEEAQALAQNDKEAELGKLGKAGKDESEKEGDAREEDPQRN